MALSLEITGKINGLQAALRAADGMVTGFAKRADATLKSGLSSLGTGAAGLVRGGLGIAATAAKAGLAAVAAAAIALPAGLTVGTKAALDLGGGLTDLSAQTGQTIADLVAMQLAFQDSGAGADKVGVSVNRLQKAMTGLNEDGEPTNEGLEMLGLSLEDLQGLTSMQQFDKIGEALRGIEDPAKRTAAAMAIFGKSGGEMLALFNDPNAFKNAASSVGRQAELLQRNAATFDAVSDLLGHAAVKMQGFFVGVASQVAPVLLPILERLDGLDFAAWGEQIGAIVAMVVQAFGDGSIGEILSQSLQVAGMELVNTLIRGIAALGAGLQQAFGSAIVLMGQGFAQYMNPQFWGVIGTWLIGAAVRFGASLLKAMTSPIQYFQAGIQYAIEGAMAGLAKIPGLNKALGLEGFQASSFEDILAQTKARPLETAGGSVDAADAAGKAMMDTAAPDIVQFAKDRIAQVADQAALVRDKAVEAYQGAPQIFDSADLQDRLGSTIEGLRTRVQDAQKNAAESSEFRPFAGSSEGKDTSKNPAVAALSSRPESAVNSLARIGGGSAGGGAMALQREGNSLLKQVVRGTADIVKAVKERVASPSSTSLEEAAFA